MSKTLPHLTPAVFLDKDGTLIEDVPYNVDPRLVQFTEGAIAALQLLQSTNYALIIISNQSGIARGYFSLTALTKLEHHLRSCLSASGVTLQGFYYCPHHPDGIIQPYNIDCTCRKPQPGLLHQAASQQAIDLNHSWMVGDILNDVEAGWAAGCRTILIDNGNETEWQLSPTRSPHYLVKNLYEAAQIILKGSR
jgi:D-glycero-D-manno-heptose 1,7-bisphosphate phosphatase